MVSAGTLFDALGAWPRHDYKAAPNWTNARPELSDQTNMAAHWDFLTTRMHRKRRNERSRAINTLNTVWSTNWKHIWLYLKLPDNYKEATNDFYWLSGRSTRNKYEEPLKENAAVVKECKRLPHQHKAEALTKRNIFFLDHKKNTKTWFEMWNKSRFVSSPVLICNKRWFLCRPCSWSTLV